MQSADTYQQKPNTNQSGAARIKYRPPSVISTTSLSELLALSGRSLNIAQGSLFAKKGDDDLKVFYAGDKSLLSGPNVSVIGSRDISELGMSRAFRIARLLVERGITVTSGLAKGVDTYAHHGAIQHDGRTIAVLGTPLDKAYPLENRELQEKIYSEHLLISQFPIGTRTYPSSFPARNRLMAVLSDASIIVEASDSSGTLHQAAECVRLKRWLFIMESVVENENLEWPKKFLKEETVEVLSSVDDVVDRIL